MSRRPACSGRHDWVAKGGHEKCSNCPAVFPCRDVCAHVDCEDVKGPPICRECKLPVKLADGFHLARVGGWLRVHLECYRPLSALVPELVVAEANEPDAATDVEPVTGHDDGEGAAAVGVETGDAGVILPA